MKTNTKTKVPATRVAGGAGAVAAKITPEQRLRRLMATCMLWEDNAYEDGKSIAQAIADVLPKCRPEFAAACAVETRTQMHLRHAPLLLVREMARHPEHKKVVAKLLPTVIQRADEIAEFLAIYWKDGKTPISAQVKKGLAKSFGNFDEYNLAKYNRDGAVRLRDVAFLTHVKPEDLRASNMLARLVNKATIPPRTKAGHLIELHTQTLNMPDERSGPIPNPGLETPDTWEVELSKGGANKKASWERLLAEKKLGGLAFIRNLRNMTQAGVHRDTLMAYAQTVKTDRVLPFRFITAVRQAPDLEALLEPLMLRGAGERPKLKGKTIVVIDCSGSMGAHLSGKSEVTRVETAAALAVLLREQCDDARFYATAGKDYNYTHSTMEIKPRRGFALAEQFSQKATYPKIGGGGIFLKQVCDYVLEHEKNCERLIILTDEQDTDHKANPKDAPAFGRHNYIINVASHKNGVGYGKWHHIDGWSEAVLDYIAHFEAME